MYALEASADLMVAAGWLPLVQMLRGELGLEGDGTAGYCC